MFGAGDLGLGGGMKDPIFLLTASLLNSGSSSTTPLSRSVLSSSAVQSAFQTLQTDFNNDVSVGAKPTHASVGQLQDDLQSIRKGTLTGTAATTAIQTDEAAILTSMGLTSTQVSQLQSDLQAVQAAIQSAVELGHRQRPRRRPARNGSTTTVGDSTSTPPRPATGTGTTTATHGDSRRRTTDIDAVPSSAVQSAFQTLQSDLKSDLSVHAQPTHASVGQVQDDLDAIQKGTLTGSQAVTTVQTDTAAVLTSMGLTRARSPRSSPIRRRWRRRSRPTQPGERLDTSITTSSSASPTSIAAVEATMQSVQQYLVGVPGLGGPDAVVRAAGRPAASAARASGGHGTESAAMPVGQVSDRRPGIAAVAAIGVADRRSDPAARGMTVGRPRRPDRAVARDPAARAPARIRRPGQWADGDDVPAGGSARSGPAGGSGRPDRRARRQYSLDRIPFSRREC